MSETVLLLSPALRSRQFVACNSCRQRKQKSLPTTTETNTVTQPGTNRRASYFKKVRGWKGGTRPPYTVKNSVPRVYPDPADSDSLTRIEFKRESATAATPPPGGSETIRTRPVAGPSPTPPHSGCWRLRRRCLSESVPGRSAAPRFRNTPRAPRSQCRAVFLPF